MVLKYLGAPDLVRREGTAVGRPRSFYCASRVRLIEIGRAGVADQLGKSRFFAERNDLRRAQRVARMLSEVNAIVLPELTKPIDSVFAEVLATRGERSTSNRGRELAVELLLDTLGTSVNALETYSWHAGVCEARRALAKRFLAHIAASYPLLADAATSMEGSVTG